MALASFILMVTIFGSPYLFSNAQQDSDDYRDAALQYHNSFRRRHQSPDLALDGNLNSMASDCAQYYLSIGNIDHSCSSKGEAGENLFAGSGQGLDMDIARVATRLWYGENRQYNYNNPGFSSGTGHFTQVVWIDSSLFGFGIARDGNDNVVAVGLYSPPGNFGFARDYADNVKPPIM